MIVIVHDIHLTIFTDSNENRTIVFSRENDIGSDRFEQEQAGGIHSFADLVRARKRSGYLHSTRKIQPGFFKVATILANLYEGDFSHGFEKAANRFPGCRNPAYLDVKQTVHVVLVI